MTILSLPPTSEPTYNVAVSRFSLTEKIPLGNPFWSTFNASFENLNLSCMGLANAIYDGRPFTTWHRNHWRKNENYECGQHIGLDFDTEDERSTLTALATDPFIKRYGAFVYTTPSHTPEKPRARVVFLLDAPIMQPTNYALAVQSLLWLFGTADRQCKEPCRFFYGSKGCEMQYLDNTLPLARIKQIIEDYNETGRYAKRIQHARIVGSAEQSEVIDALNRIPAWGIEYEDWVRVLMALQAEFGEAGLAIAEDWAQEGYRGEVARKWRGFKPAGNTTGAVTIATVFGLAKQFGWQKAA